MHTSRPSRLIACVFFPFAAGYYLSYLFRTINALISSHLIADIGIGAADLGLLTSIYFLVFAGAWLFGTAVHCFRRRGVGAESILTTVAVLFIAAQSALILREPLPSLLPWSVVAVVGAASVVSFAVIADYFPPELAGRANGALNVLHFGWAFLAQYATGLILEQWSPGVSHKPVLAYQVAFGLNVILQIAAMAWFALPWLHHFGPWIGSFDASDAIEPVCLYEQAILQVFVDDDAEW
ncbi:hypothetical protein IC762_30605 [Bradyrhizobium genosp. L]|uniref:hypothetical protein n=1 Tax=Bradyrhizobium genosp. L TaxID=83637 RepID=UPI0018A31427|nr:hypothetical protein [Bradyrhizobium genosp. L]QPF83955.1 hypothetical protein IC762_30605 [Bradyrhizobium genosp. L]